MEEASALARRLGRLDEDRRHALKVLRRERGEVRRSKKLVRLLRKALTLVQQVAQAVQNRVHDQISRVVTRCVHAVYGKDSYRFDIVFEKKRNRTEARPRFLKGDDEIPVDDSVGGGVVDVAAFGLRLVCMLLSPVRRLLVLDEPFKNVNGELYQQRAALLIETLAQELDVQFILFTDDCWLKIGKVIDLET